ncbi:electron transfer flavoprotein subunit beta [Bacteroidia bacterium]|nr:electron transfer flavoprotein subunit beta [Bacteroidia bacterium]
MSFNIVVLAKQVPDTRNVGKDAMKEDGTVNRAALPAIYNPEDLNALEMALKVKDKIADAKVYIITMGPARAAEIVRESIYRGADGGYLVSDMKFAGADTLATSYTISVAIKKLGKVDLIFGGRQAIDGDTAQVGPQTAEKLSIPQITYAEEIVAVDEKCIVIRRRLERGFEDVKSPYPCLVTVHDTAEECRPRNVKRLIKYKHAKTKTELTNNQVPSYLQAQCGDNYPEHLLITEWTAADIGANPEQLGLLGSPTKVKQIESVVLAAKDSVHLTPKDEDIDGLLKELIAGHILG